MAAGNRPAPVPPRWDLTLPANDPRPFFVCVLPCAVGDLQPLGAALPRVGLRVLARVPLSGPSLLSPGGQHRSWKRGIGEENGGSGPPTWCPSSLSLSFVLTWSVSFCPPSRRCCGVSSGSAWRPLTRGTSPPHSFSLVSAPTFLHVVARSPWCGPWGSPLLLPAPLSPPAYQCFLVRLPDFLPSLCVFSRSSSPLTSPYSVACVCFPIPCFIFSATASALVLQAIVTELSML